VLRQFILGGGDVGQGQDGKVGYGESLDKGWFWECLTRKPQVPGKGEVYDELIGNINWC